MLRFLNHSSYLFYFEHRGCCMRIQICSSAHSKYYGSNISMCPFFLLVNSRGGESYWLIRIRLEQLSVHPKLKLWTPAHTPGDNQTSWVYSSNPVLHLYISSYLIVNKPVLSYRLLCLLPQWWPWSGCTLCIVHCTFEHPRSHVGSHQR